MLAITLQRSWAWLAILAVGLLGCGSPSASGSRGTGGSSARGGAAGRTSSGVGGMGGGAGQSDTGGNTGGAAGGSPGASGGAGGAAPTCSARVSCSDPNLVCDTDTGTCVECLADSDCSPQHCDVTQHACVDCIVNADCSGSTPNCSSGHSCGAACNNSSTCPTDTPVCETSSHTCVECLINADCDPNGFCQADRTCL